MNSKSTGGCGNEDEAHNAVASRRKDQGSLQRSSVATDMLQRAEHLKLKQTVIIEGV